MEAAETRAEHQMLDDIGGKARTWICLAAMLALTTPNL